MRQRLFVALVVVLAASCSENPEKPDTTTDAAVDSTDMAAADQSTAVDANGGVDVGLGDVGAPDLGIADVGPADVGMDAGDMSPDMYVAAECGEIDTSSFSGDEGDGCESNVVCDGVEYRVDCLNDVCTCSVDGVQSPGNLSVDFCFREGLKECGARLPIVNPVCYESDAGGLISGGDSCTRSVTCNDVYYQMRCDTAAGTCECLENREPSSETTSATGCGEGYLDGLRDCGAPIQPDP